MLDLYPRLMVFVMLIFLFLLYQLTIKLYQPLLRFMDSRDEMIASDLKSANNLGGDAKELLQEADSILNDAKSKATKMRQDAIESFKNRNSASFAKRESELESEYLKFQEELNRKREKLRSSVLSQMPLIKESLKAKFTQI
jgi:F-type H+-transporting ATPase subunit b